MCTNTELALSVKKISERAKKPSTEIFEDIADVLQE
jgi:hypothetical protein